LRDGTVLRVLNLCCNTLAAPLPPALARHPTLRALAFEAPPPPPLVPHPQWTTSSAQAAPSHNSITIAPSCYPATLFCYPVLQIADSRFRPIASGFSAVGPLPLFPGAAGASSVTAGHERGRARSWSPQVGGGGRRRDVREARLSRRTLSLSLSPSICLSRSRARSVTSEQSLSLFLSLSPLPHLPTPGPLPRPRSISHPLSSPPSRVTAAK
jgi:hypothetical protein